MAPGILLRTTLLGLWTPWASALGREVLGSWGVREVPTPSPLTYKALSRVRDFSGLGGYLWAGPESVFHLGGLIGPGK